MDKMEKRDICLKWRFHPNVRVRADLSQVQCIKSYQAQEHDELTLEKADILQAKTITSDGMKQDN